MDTFTCNINDFLSCANSNYLIFIRAGQIVLYFRWKFPFSKKLTTWFEKKFHSEVAWTSCGQDAGSRNVTQPRNLNFAEPCMFDLLGIFGQSGPQFPLRMDSPLPSFWVEHQDMLPLVETHSWWVTPSLLNGNMHGASNATCILASWTTVEHFLAVK